MERLFVFVVVWVSLGMYIACRSTVRTAVPGVCGVLFLFRQSDLWRSFTVLVVSSGSVAETQTVRSRMYIERGTRAGLLTIPVLLSACARAQEEVRKVPQCGSAALSLDFKMPPNDNDRHGVAHPFDGIGTEAFTVAGLDPNLPER